MDHENEIQEAQESTCEACPVTEAAVTDETEAAVRDTAEETEAAAEESEETEETEETEESEETEKTEEPAAEASAAPSPARLALTVVALIAIVALLVAFISSGMQKKSAESAEAESAPAAMEATVPADGNPDDVTCKGTYTAEAALVSADHDAVVATMGDRTLTVGQLQVYYWLEVRQFLNQYASYAPYFGLDYTQPLDTQVCGIEETPMTWQQFFLESALDTWHTYQAMALEAEARGISLDAEAQAELDGLEAEIAAAAENYGYASADDFLQQSMGPAVTVEDYRDYMRIYYTGYGYYVDVMNSFEATDEELLAYFNDNAEQYAANGLTLDGKLVNVRHILIQPEEAAEGEEQDWAAAEAQAQQILDTFLAGEQTEDAFAALANEHSTDPGSNTNGGLYESVTRGEMVQPFNDWCFDQTRQSGDTGIVKTSYGYHVMYFVTSRPEWMLQAAADLKNETGSHALESAMEKYPMTVDYTKILLGQATMN